MEFDKSRVYSAVNADELKPGDKVIVADSITELKNKLLNEFEGEVLTGVLNEEWHGRFEIGDNNYALAYLVERKENCTNCKFKLNPECNKSKWPEQAVKLFRCDDYVPKTKQKAEKHTDYNHCEEAMISARLKKHYRPFRDTDELVKVWCDKGGKWQKRELTMPHIWVRNKERGSQELIVAYNGDMFLTEYAQGNMERLLEWYTFLDGSLCGVEVE